MYQRVCRTYLQNVDAALISINVLQLFGKLQI